MRKSGRHGVAWIEILIVLLIIAIIAVILQPRFTKDPATEAKHWLGQICTSQQGYWQHHGTYAADLGILDLGIPQASKYTYSITFADSISFTAKAEEDLEGIGVADVWTTDQTEKLVQKGAD
ncbi:MAG: type IV pilin-like G/H family protein [Candidatus Latescibacterota bacterium]